MKKYLQLHLLTAYPPSNLNRDDLGRPKTAVVGGTPRLRISSQSLKRAWRTSEVFQKALGSLEINGKLGIRTKRMGREIYQKLVEGEIKEKDAAKWTREIANVFGKIKPEKKIDEAIAALEKNENASPPEVERKKKELEISKMDIEQLAFFTPEEQKAIDELIKKMVETKKGPTKEDLELLRDQNSAADVAMFGRMLADHPINNIEAAVQVGHAFSVQKVTVEDDFFTAVDDLNKGEEEVGAGHMGDVEFASGIFYLYINIDRELLLENLNGHGEQAREEMNKAIQALVESAATVAPTGKQNTFASRARANYVLAELGDQQPRSLSLAFVKDVRSNMLESSVKQLEDFRKKMDQGYGKCADDFKIMNILNGEGSLKEIQDFCVGD